MTDHQKEIAKFLFRPIWYPISEISKAIWEILALWFKTLSGEDSCDAWFCFAITMIVLSSIAMLTSVFTMTLYWKTFGGIAIVLYIGFYYYREYIKRK